VDQPRRAGRDVAERASRDAGTGPAAEQPVFTKRKALERRFLEEADRNCRDYVGTKTAKGAGAAIRHATVQAVDAAGDARRHSPRRPALLVRGQTRQEESSHPALDVFIRWARLG
jgi:hypothetical protein